MQEVQRFDYDDAARARDYVADRLRERGLDPNRIQEGLTLGSGLGNFPLDHMGLKDGGGESSPLTIPFATVFQHLNEVEGRPPISIPEEGVKGHARQLIIGPLDGAGEDLIVAQAGREHPYEGISLRRATFWLRVMQLFGTKLWVGSNASGIVTPDTLTVPSLMLVESSLDEADFAGPLVGLNDERFGPRFPHHSDRFSPTLLEAFQRSADHLGLGRLPQGMYVRSMGPHYESPEQVYDLRARLRRIWEEAAAQPGESRFRGGVTGVVGMSSTYEIDVTQHASQSSRFPAFRRGRGLVSVSTNYSASLGPNGIEAPSNHDEVTQNARTVEERFGQLVSDVIVASRE